MTIRTSLWVCAAVMAAAMPQSANAQSPGLMPVVDVAPPYAGALPPYEVMTIVRSSGFYPIGRPVRVGAVYQIAALDPYEMNVRLIVDARSGQILAVRDFAEPGYPAGPAYYRPGPGDGRLLPPRPIGGPYYEERPTPPRSIPFAPASHSAAVTPHAPVPRARPPAAANEKATAQAPEAPNAPVTTGSASPARAPAPAESAAKPPAAASDGAKGVVLPPVQPLD